MAIIIDVKVPRSDKATSTFDRLHKKFLQIDKTIERWADSLDRAAASAQKLSMALNARPARSPRAPGGSISRPGSSPGGRQRTPRQQTPYDQFRYIDTLNRITGGQYQGQRDAMLRSVFQHYHGLAGQGDPGALKKLTTLLPKYHQMMSPKSGGMGQKLMQLLSTSRIGFGHGGMQLMPLVGKLAGLAGPSGPIGMAVAGAGMALAESIKLARDFILNAVSGRSIAGGTWAQNAQMAKLGAAAGIDNSADAARRLQAGIEKGFGQSYAVQAGINPVGGLSGDMNYAEKFNKYMKFVMNSRSFEEARRKAEAVGMPELANSYYLTEGTKKYAQQQAASGVSDFDAQQMAEFNFWLKEAVRQGTLLFSRLLLPRIKEFAFYLEWINKILDYLANAIRNLAKRLGLNAGKNEKKIQEDHTKAMVEHARAMRDSRETLGGGRRAQEALPGRLNGFQLNDAGVRNAIRWGAA